MLLDRTLVIGIFKFIIILNAEVSNEYPATDNPINEEYTTCNLA